MYIRHRITEYRLKGCVGKGERIFCHQLPNSQNTKGSEMVLTHITASSRTCFSPSPLTYGGRRSGSSVFHLKSEPAEDSPRDTPPMMSEGGAAPHRAGMGWGPGTPGEERTSGRSKLILEEAKGRKKEKERQQQQINREGRKDRGRGIGCCKGQTLSVKGTPGARRKLGLCTATWWDSDVGCLLWAQMPGG